MEATLLNCAPRAPSGRQTRRGHILPTFGRVLPRVARTESPFVTGAAEDNVHGFTYFNSAVRNAWLTVTHVSSLDSRFGGGRDVNLLDYVVSLE